MDATPWLDEREARAWRNHLRMHARLTSRLHRSLQRHAGLSGADYEVLVHLSEAPGGRLRAFELAEAMRWERSRLSHQLARMERRGLVTRTACPTDARGADVALGRPGRAALERAAPRHVADVRRYFLDALTPAQLDALAEIGEAVLARLDAEPDPPPA